MGEKITKDILDEIEQYIVSAKAIKINKQQADFVYWYDIKLAIKRLLSNLSPNKENEKRDFIYCLNKNCDGYKGGLWVDKLKQDDTHNAFICPDCCKLIPVVNINVERNLLIKENK